MNENPPNKWKQPLTGKRKWLALLAVVAVVECIIVGFALATGKPGPISELILAASFLAVITSTVGMLIFWFSRWFFRWRNFRRFLFGAACFVTLIALYYAEENWRGKRAWEKFKREWEAKGERFDLAAVVPPPVPDDQNFAMTPLLASLFDFHQGTQTWRDTNAVEHAMNISPRYDKAAGRMKSVMTVRSNSWVIAQMDLAAWGVALQRSDTNDDRCSPSTVSTNIPRREAAGKVLAALAEANSALEELREASQRPLARYNLSYDAQNPAAIIIPHLRAGRRICQILQLRACSELALGQNVAAFNDINLALRLAESLRGEPFLISHLVCVAEVMISLQPIFEGLAVHQWTEPQLQALQQRLQHFDFIANERQVLAGERILYGDGAIECVRRDPNKYRVFTSPVPSGAEEFRLHAILTAIAPDGWFDLEKLNYNRLFNDCLTPIDVENRRISPERSRKANARLNEKLNAPPVVFFLRHQLFSALLLPALTKTGQKTAVAQTGVDLAVLACALERYRLAHGEHPETLDALAPQFVGKLPRDIIDGQPLKYRRTANGGFVLYSVGWNETDDGGQVILDKDGKSKWEQGDWVWPMPAK